MYHPAGVSLIYLLLTPIQSPTPPTIPTASGSTQPFCQDTERGQTDRPIDRQMV